MIIGFRTTILLAALSWVGYVYYGVNDNPGMAAIAGIVGIALTFLALPVLFVLLVNDDIKPASYKK